MASSKLVTHTYVTDGASKPILTASSDKVLDLNLKVSHIADSDPTIGGVWKFSEHFVVNEMTIQGEITKKDYADHTIVFDSYVSDLAINFAKAIHPGMDDAALAHYQELFGSTKIHLWYNKSYPLINVIIYNPNEIDSSLVKPEDKDLVERVFNVGRLGYPSLIFTGDTTKTKSFNFAGLTEDSKTKLANLGCSDADETFSGEWHDEYYNEVSVASWYKEVVTWVENHNRALISDERKKDPEWMMTVDDSFRLYDHLSSLHVLTKGKIEKVEDLFFNISVPEDAFYLEAKGGDAQVNIVKVDGPYDRNFMISNDGIKYRDYTIASNIYIPSGTKVYIRAKTAVSALAREASRYYKFVINSGKVEAHGNIMYLIDPTGATRTAGAYCFSRLFTGCSGLLTAPELPATTLGTDCYLEMFRNCTSLVQAPELPATTLALACYMGMFQGCSALKIAPELPATTLADSCYKSMFAGSGLKTAPVLPATQLTEYCYASMFSTCESLTQAPVLPATEMSRYCYNNMFAYCSALKAAPSLPATTLAASCYEKMFSYCDALILAPELPATKLESSCYSQMFYWCHSLTTLVLPATALVSRCYYWMCINCNKLNNVTMLATNIGEDIDRYRWLENVASTGTFTKSSGVEIPSGTSGIPNGWTVVEQ